VWSSVKGMCNLRHRSWTSTFICLAFTFIYLVGGNLDQTMLRPHPQQRHIGLSSLPETESFLLTSPQFSSQSLLGPFKFGSWGISGTYQSQYAPVERGTNIAEPWGDRARTTKVREGGQLHSLLRCPLGYASSIGLCFPTLMMAIY
jgi:hypothetical protein